MTTRILAQFQRQHLAEQYAKHVAQAIGDNSEPESIRTEIEYVDVAIGQERMARGVPVLARGISGAISGTRPDSIA